MVNSSNLEKIFEDSFSSFCTNNKIDERETFVVAVSGGADSLALAFLLENYCKKKSGRLVAVTVNHNLRSDSVQEAQYVSELMKKHQIEHHILSWDGEKPKTGIEEEARINRYRLLLDFCCKFKYKYLLTAHHIYDQAETFLMRLQRGSGVDGLCGMQEISNFGDGYLLRPLLNFYPESLKTYLQEREILWKEDSMNECDDFLRVRIRKMLPILDEKLGISVERLVKTSKTLSKTREYLEFQTKKFIAENAKIIDENCFCFSEQKLKQEHDELLFRVLSKTLKDVSEKYYTPEAEKIENLCQAIKLENFKGKTLSGCEIFSRKGLVWIIPEMWKTNDIEKKKLKYFIDAKYPKTDFPYKVKKYLFLKAIEF